MGTDHYIACEERFEFLDLHKWLPDNDLASHNPCALKLGTYCGARTTRARVEAAIDTAKRGLLKEHPQHWIATAIPALVGFLNTHSNHSLTLYNDCADLPWYSTEAGWHRWKEIQGPMSCWSDDFEDVDLPRNIIDDLGIRNWPDALAHYEANCPCIHSPSIPDNLKDIFCSHLPGNTPPK